MRSRYFTIHTTDKKLRKYTRWFIYTVYHEMFNIINETLEKVVLTSNNRLLFFVLMTQVVKRECFENT